VRAVRPIVTIGIILTAACAPHRSAVVFDLRPGPASDTKRLSTEVLETAYSPVSGKAAVLLGCDVRRDLPVCAIAEPSLEEDSAFRAEAARLADHPDARCRRLGQAIRENEPGVRMYRKALVREAEGVRLYGVGHAYVLDYVWQIRVARKLDDLNERSLDEMKRTLRHEMSHTIGATEVPGVSWSAEEYATRCG
jgi:hypothetical protein